MDDEDMTGSAKDAGGREREREGRVMKREEEEGWW